ncbi:transposase, partial [Actinopolymorpha rutila]
MSAASQLDALLSAHWPGPLGMFDRLDSPIGLAFLARYPTPVSASRLTAARLGAFLRRNSYSGKKPPEELLARLGQAPKPTGCLDESTLTGLVNAHVNQLRALLAILKELNHTIAVAVEAHPYAGLFAPMPRIGGLNLAQVVGEVGPILERAENAAQVAAEVGVAPVTHESGTRRSVVFRMAVNHHARQAMTVFADNSRHADEWAAGLYADARARGKRHPHAIRILARAWIRVMWQCWKTNTAYDPSRPRQQKW